MHLNNSCLVKLDLSAHSVALNSLLIILSPNVAGGFNQQGFLSSVECYCPDRNEWKRIADMPVGRSGMGVAVTMEPCPGSLPEPEDEEQDGVS